MKTSVLIPVVVLVCVSTVHPAAGQSNDSRSARPVEVTPFAAFSSYPSFRVGAAVTFPLTDQISIESETGWRLAPSDLTASVSLLYSLRDIKGATPYLAAGVGLAPYRASLFVPTGQLIPVDSTTVTVNAGGGIKMPVTDNWGLRTDARWFNGLADGAGDHWRVYNGVTFRAGR
jgi:opacity protein-like surface antigen